MNAIAMNQFSSGEFIFGDQQLHLRFFTAIELLAEIVISAPLPVSSLALAKTMGKPVPMVRMLLRSLGNSGLIYQNEKSNDMWYFSGIFGMISLADIFPCIFSLTEKTVLQKEKSNAALADSPRTPSQQNVDLLLMQATMAVNQVVLQQLQQFDLGRLNAAECPLPSRIFKRPLGVFGTEL